MFVIACCCCLTFAVGCCCCLCRSCSNSNKNEAASNFLVVDTSVPGLVYRTASALASVTKSRGVAYLNNYFQFFFALVCSLVSDGHREEELYGFLDYFEQLDDDHIAISQLRVVHQTIVTNFRLDEA
jgi:hypothetical protein